MKRFSLEEECLVHVISRVVQRRWLMDEEGMEAMMRIMRTQAAFAGFHVVTFCFLSNHFHILLHVDPATAKEGVSDEELVRRFRALYGNKRSLTLGCDAESLECLLQEDDERAARLRAQLIARMGSVPVFMRELKTRFTRWYNDHFSCVGTFWAERYRSVWIEAGSPAARLVAAYIDLNPVRAGLTTDPLHYRFCGAGQAACDPHRAKEAYRWLAPDAKNPAALLDRYMEFVHTHCPNASLEMSTAKTGEEEPPGLLQQCTAFSQGLALGTHSWVSALCRRAGVIGFRKDRKPKKFSVCATEAPIATASQRPPGF